MVSRLDNDYDNDDHVDGDPRPFGLPDYHIPADVKIRLLIDVSITKIDAYACYECRTLMEVVFHDNVTEIGPNAFAFCYNLPRVELAEGLLRVEVNVFFSCNSLREIVIPASVRLIDDDVFYGCDSLIRVVFAPRTTSVELGRRMFEGCSDLRFVTLPHNLQSIPDWFFLGCTSLTHLQLPVSVEQFGTCVFRESGIQAMNISMGDDFVPGTIILPPKLQSIPYYCFDKCKSLTNIRIPDSVQQIDERALSGSDLRSITIPNNVNQIGPYAFWNCLFLEKVTFHSSNNLMIEWNIFENCPLLSVIMMHPWMWPKLFVSMEDHPDFILKFFRQYQTQIFDFNDWWANRVVMQEVTMKSKRRRIGL